MPMSPGYSCDNVVAVEAEDVTLIENAGNAAEECPSLTLMMIFEAMPTLDKLGVPLNRPVEVSKLAQSGRFWIEKVNVSPSVSLAVGANEYADPASTVVAGVPEIVGAELELELDEEDPDDVPDPEAPEDDELEPVADCAVPVVAAVEASELEPPHPESTPRPRHALSASSVSLP
jgi:hypothetical protein